MTNHQAHLASARRAYRMAVCGSSATRCAVWANGRKHCTRTSVAADKCSSAAPAAARRLPASRPEKQLRAIHAGCAARERRSAYPLVPSVVSSHSGAPRRTVTYAASMVQDLVCTPDVAATAAPDNKLSTSETVVRAALHFKTHGWAVVPDVITRDECEAYIDSVWEWLESLGTGVKRNDASTWGDERWPPKFFDSGIINKLEVAHQDFVWKLRADERITSIFAAMWGTDALLSSFDSINVMRPPAITHPGRDLRAQASQSWWHTDQAPSKTGLHCIQGLLNLTNVGPHAGTIMVREGSHKAHEAFWSEASELPASDKAAIGDFYMFKPQELGYWDRFQAKALRGYGPGSLFIWDSRTVHQNCPPSDPTIWRHVLYTCYQPAALATEADLAAKRHAYDSYSITTHWPAANVTVGGPPSAEEKEKYTLPRTRSRVENDKILKLAGQQPYDPATERRCKPLVDASVPELEALLAAHELRKAHALADQARQLAERAIQMQAAAAAGQHQANGHAGPQHDGHGNAAVEADAAAGAGQQQPAGPGVEGPQQNS